MTEPIESLYYRWLVAKVTDPHARTPSQTHWRLLQQLYATEYVWSVLGDDNRAEDGMHLRYEYSLQVGEAPDDGWYNMPCSVFEMVYGLSRQAAFKDSRHPYEWFWEIMDNLGLSHLCDAAEYDEHFVAYILDRLVWRTYDRNGDGGMFPLHSPMRDQRKVEIWYQLEGYLAEREHV